NSTPIDLGVILRGRRDPGADTSRKEISTVHWPTRRRSDKGGSTRGDISAGEYGHPPPARPVPKVEAPDHSGKPFICQRQPAGLVALCSPGAMPPRAQDWFSPVGFVGLRETLRRLRSPHPDVA